jgi:hypothetical protein
MRATGIRCTSPPSLVRRDHRRYEPLQLASRRDTNRGTMKTQLLCVTCALLSVTVMACREPAPPEDTGSGQDATTQDRQPPGPDAQGGQDVNNPPADGGGGMDGGGATTVTLRQLQDITDMAHPAANARVNLEDTDLVALTPRLLIGSSTASSCRFAVWVGKATGGDFGGIQVQELVDRGGAMNCFDMSLVRKIPADIAVGTRITSVVNANFGEFCAGPAGGNPGMCRNYEQSQLFLGAATAAINTMGMGTVPTPSDVTVPAIGQTSGGMLGTRTLALEGTLVRVRNVRVTATMSSNDGGAAFTTVSVADPMDATRTLEVQISNFTRTSCVRTFFNGLNGMNAASITGILVPDFGVWKIRLRNENDVEGINCTTGDAGAMTDASADVVNNG